MWNCSLTPKILNLALEITRLLANSNANATVRPDPKLRRSARAKSLHGSAAIEGNSLRLDQVESLLEGRSIATLHQKEVVEIRNAAVAYEKANTFKPFSTQDFCKAHKILMKGLIDDAGKYRAGSIGVWQGSKVRHVAPPAKRVPKLMDDLFANLDHQGELSLLLRAAIAHYEIEFIHPFSDGNGRMGRLWQQVILLQVSPIFGFCPVESVIYDRQEDYYKALRQSDKKADACFFVEFALDSLLVALKDTLKQIKPKKQTVEDRILFAKKKFGKKEFSRKEYLELFPSLSTATASRDLAKGISNYELKKSGKVALSTYRFSKN